MSRLATNKYDGRLGHSPDVSVKAVVEKRRMIVAPGQGRCTGPLQREDTGMNDVPNLNLAGRSDGNAPGMRRAEHALHRKMPVCTVSSDRASSLEAHRDRQLAADAVRVYTTRNRSIS